MATCPRPDHHLLSMSRVGTIYHSWVKLSGSIFVPPLEVDKMTKIQKTDGQTHGRTDRQMGGWMDGWMDGWMEGFMDSKWVVRRADLIE